MSKYQRSVAELRQNAVFHWPYYLLDQNAEVSVLPLLLETQDKFIGVLTIADGNPAAWKDVLPSSPEINNTIFLKHLMVLTDLGGEALNKVPPFDRRFPNGVMTYVWREQSYEYPFQRTDAVRLHNPSLKVDGKSLLRKLPLSDIAQDVIMLLLHGAAAYGDSLPIEVKEKCMIGSLLGHPAELREFVKQSYIRVSQQLRGASSNSLGNLAQKFVIETLSENLAGWQVRSGRIPGISHDNGNTETSFDVVVKSPSGVYFAVEISFQVTTNSVIERKSGQAQARAKMLRDAGHYMCYVIDGAGNLNVRHHAVGIICEYSDCTTAFSPDEIRFLAQFMRETEEERTRGDVSGPSE